MEKKSYADKAKIPPPPAPSSKIPPLPAPSIKPLTPSEAKTGIERFTNELRNSPRVQSLTSFFEQGQKTEITQCICLGLGHFMNLERKPKRFREATGNFNESLHELAMLRVLLEGLTQEGDEKMQVYVLGTIFSPAEREYLQSLGYILFRDRDAGLARMSNSTFLYVPYLKGLGIFSALINSFPALYVGEHLDKAVEHIGRNSVAEPAGGKEEHIRTLERFRRSSSEAKALPISAQGTEDGRVFWSDASVHWLDTGYDEEKVADQPKKEDGKSKTGKQKTLPSSSTEKETGETIDYWDWDGK